MIKRTFLLILVFFVQSAFAEPEYFGRITVLFKAKKAEELWIAKTIQESVKSYTAGFSNLIFLDPSEAFQNCQDTQCLLLEAENQKIDYFWTGLLSGSSLSYQIVDVERRKAVRSGSFTLGRWFEQDLQVQSLIAIKPIVRHGGLIDIKGEQSKGTMHLGKTNVPEIINSAQDHSAKSTQEIEEQQFSIIENTIYQFGWILCLLGGCLWAIVLYRVGRFCLGGFHGIQKIDHASLFVYLRAMSEVVLTKVFISLPIMILPLWISYNLLLKTNLVSLSSFIMVISPVVLTVMLFLVFIVNKLLTRHLDSVYLIKYNPRQNDKIQFYLRTYIQRMGLDVPEYILESLDFQVAPYIDNEIMYGGFGQKIRIILPSWIVDSALGYIARFDTVAKQEQQTWYSSQRWPMSLLQTKSSIFPSYLNQKTEDRKSDDAFDSFQNDFSVQYISEEDMARDPEISKSSGVWGFVLPHKEKDSIPLISDNYKDLEAVEQLMSEHHIFYEKPKVEEVYDDSNPNQKEFLFGLLLQILGRVHRHETILNTFSLAASRLKYYIPDILLLPFDYFKKFYDKNFSIFWAFIDDSYVALNNCGPHLVQYLYFLNTRRVDLLTSRADGGQLILRSNEILRWMAQQAPSKLDLQKNRATLRNRLLSIGSFFHYKFKPNQPKRRLPWKRSLAVFTVFFYFGLQAFYSIQFNQVYLKRMDKLKLDIEAFENPEVAAAAAAAAAAASAPTPTTQRAAEVELSKPESDKAGKTKTGPAEKSSGKAKVSKDNKKATDSTKAKKDSAAKVKKSNELGIKKVTGKKAESKSSAKEKNNKKSNSSLKNKKGVNKNGKN